MTNNDAEKLDFDPKHRIIGAVVLVALVVILIPMFINDRTEDVDEVIEVISNDVTEASGHEAVLGIDSSNKKTNPDVVSKSKSASTEQQDDLDAIINKLVDKSKKAKQDDTKTAQARQPKTDIATKANTISKPVIADKLKVKAGTNKTWSVQMGTYFNRANATRLHQKLKKRGYKASLDSIQLKKNTATRVRVGPYDEKQAAVNILGKIEKDIGIEGVVLANP